MLEGGGLSIGSSALSEGQSLAVSLPPSLCIQRIRRIQNPVCQAGKLLHRAYSSYTFQTRAQSSSLLLNLLLNPRNWHKLFHATRTPLTKKFLLHLKKVHFRHMNGHLRSRTLFFTSECFFLLLALICEYEHFGLHVIHTASIFPMRSPRPKQ